MKVICNLDRILLMVFCFFCFVSCDNDGKVELIDPSYKTLITSSGGDFGILTLFNNWSIESVKDISSGEELLNKDGTPLRLDGFGSVEASNGWLTLTRDNENQFVISLKENFNKLEDRKFEICISDTKHKDYILITQQAGTEYQIVKTTYEEVEEQRVIFDSDENCITLKLTNSTSEATWEPTGYIYENVVESSIFESDEYGAFDWVPKEGIAINVPELIVDGTSRWTKMCIYKEGETTIPYIKDIANGNRIKLLPYSTLYLDGEVTYCKRVCNYTFTIQNMGSGTQFEVNGIWSSIVPISTHTTSY